MADNNNPYRKILEEQLKNRCLDELLDKTFLEPSPELEERLSKIQKGINPSGLLAEERQKNLSLEKISEEVHYNNQIILTMGRQFNSGIKYFGGGIINLCRGFVEGHLIIPSVLIRHDFDPDRIKTAYDVGAMLPIVGHLVFGIYPVIGYSVLFHYTPKIATFILTTQSIFNLASGLYEWYQYEKNKFLEKNKNDK